MEGNHEYLLHARFGSYITHSDTAAPAAPSQPLH